MKAKGALLRCGLPLVVFSSAVTAGVLWKTSSLPSPLQLDSPPAELSRDIPLTLSSTIQRCLVVDKTKWAPVVRQFREIPETNVTPSYMLHVLKVAERGDDELASTLLEYLTDNRAGQKVFGGVALIRTQFGVRYEGRPSYYSLDESNRAWEPHRDLVLSAFAERGISLREPLIVDGNVFHVRDLLTDSLANFSLEQEELPWTAIAYALYMPSPDGWRNRYGEEFDFNMVVKRLLDTPLIEQSCFGTHVLFALTVIYRVNSAGYGILSPASRDLVEIKLTAAVKAIEQAQHSDGSWTADWSVQLTEKWSGSIVNRHPAASAENTLTATGHVAEWLTQVPEDWRTSDEGVQKAGRWLIDELSSAELVEIQRSICPFSHAAYIVNVLGKE